MPSRHRIKIHHVRANPPIATVYVNFCFGGNMTVVFGWKPIHFKDDFFSAAQFDHRFSAELVADESVVDVVIFLLATPLLKLISSMEMWKSIFSSSIARLNLSALSRCSREPTSCTLCELPSTGFPFDRDFA